MRQLDPEIEQDFGASLQRTGSDLSPWGWSSTWTVTVRSEGLLGTEDSPRSTSDRGWMGTPGCWGYSLGGLSLRRCWGGTAECEFWIQEPDKGVFILGADIRLPTVSLYAQILTQYLPVPVQTVLLGELGAHITHTHQTAAYAHLLEFF